ncbi:MAG TPA: hypothetical protein VK120_01240 [Sporosarcina sp.]|nr:hypothetical protein [Sporosarcina sp.]
MREEKLSEWHYDKLDYELKYYIFDEKSANHALSVEKSSQLILKTSGNKAIHW